MIRLRKVHRASWCLLAALLILFVISVRFAWSDVTGSFEDDSVNYIILAKWMSPWFHHSELISKAAAFEKYPPLFPLILALTGASHNLLLAHIIVAILHIAAVALAYQLGRKMLENNWAALVGALLFAVLPSVWINLLGILSENLYLVISLLVLLYFSRLESRVEQAEKREILILAILLTLLIMTRTIGVALVAAYFSWCLCRYRSIRRLLKADCSLPLLMPVLAALAWSYLKPGSGEVLYQANVMRGLLELDVWPQLDAMPRYWVRAFLVYWSNANLVQGITILCFGILALLGIAHRIKGNMLDGWYSFFYLVIITIYPFASGIGRFFHGLLPLLIIQAMVGLGVALGRVNRSLRHRLVNYATVILLVMVLPSLTFIAGRAGYHTTIPRMDLSRVTQFYSDIDPQVAHYRAMRNEQLRLDFEEISLTTPEAALIMWFEPQYLRLYSGRDGVRIPSFSTEIELARSVKSSAAGWVFLSDLNPKFSMKEFSGLDLLPYFEPFTRVIWKTVFPGSNRVASIMLAVDEAKLDAFLENDLAPQQ